MTFKRRQNMAGYIFVSPWIVGTIVLLLFPLLYSITLSFMHLENNQLSISSMRFAGLEYYKKAFVTDVEFIPKFLAEVKEMLIFTPMILILSLIIAIMLSRDIKARGFFRSMFFLPVLLGTGFVMEQVLGMNIDQEATETARSILLPPQVMQYIGPTVSGYIMAFFNSVTLVMWKSGVQIVIALAGIQSISPSLYESAKVDGASEWEMFWKITLPMMVPILLLNSVYTIVASMTDVTKAGGQQSIITYIVDTNFGSDFSYSAAMGWIYFMFILIVVLFIFLITRPFIKKASDA